MSVFGGSCLCYCVRELCIVELGDDKETGGLLNLDIEGRREPGDSQSYHFNSLSSTMETNRGDGIYVSPDLISYKGAFCKFSIGGHIFSRPSF